MQLLIINFVRLTFIFKYRQEILAKLINISKFINYVKIILKILDSPPPPVKIRKILIFHRSFLSKILTFSTQYIKHKIPIIFTVNEISKDLKEFQ